MRWLAVVVVIAACGSHGGGGGGGGGDDDTDAPARSGEPADLAGITGAHDQVRAAVDTTGIAAGPLSPLVWDDRLASYAAAWVAMCQDSDGDGLVDHDPNRTNVAGFSYIGENIYASSGTATGGDAVDDWASEQASYDYATNSCAAGAVCGHYTQVVWRATTSVGCALHTCAGLRYPSTIVCDYGPGGNIDGEPPY